MNTLPSQGSRGRPAAPEACPVPGTGHGQKRPTTAGSSRCGFCRPGLVLPDQHAPIPRSGGPAPAGPPSRVRCLAPDTARPTGPAPAGPAGCVTGGVGTPLLIRGRALCGALLKKGGVISMRTLRAIALPLVAAGLLATPSTGGPDRDFEADVHAGAGGTGLLPNFQAKGDSLVRLLAGAFDPAAGSLPAGAGIGLRDRATLPAGTAQYWLVQVRDQRFAAVVGAVTRRQAGRSPEPFLTTPTWCVPRPHSAMRSLPTARQFAGAATTSPRGASRWQLPGSPACSSSPAGRAIASRVLGRSCGRRGRSSLEADARRQGCPGRGRRRRHRGDGGADSRNRCASRRGVDRRPPRVVKHQHERTLGQRHRRPRPLCGDRAGPPERCGHRRGGRRHGRQLQARPERPRAHRLPRLRPARRLQGGDLHAASSRATRPRR